jgi:hypothetical protein
MMIAICSERNDGYLHICGCPSGIEGNAVRFVKITCYHFCCAGDGVKSIYLVRHQRSRPETIDKPISSRVMNGACKYARIETESTIDERDISEEDLAAGMYFDIVQGIELSAEIVIQDDGSVVW